MKIWNMNKLTGVLAVFNCQGAGTWSGLENASQTNGLELSGDISPADIDYLREISPEPLDRDFAVFSFKSGSLSRLSMHEKLNVKYRTLECDVFTVSPIKVYHQDIQFAPIGLINMYNSGGAVEAVEAFDHGLRIRGRGGGVFGAYSSVEPKFCSVNMTDVEFKCNSEQHLLTVNVPTGKNTWDVSVHY